MKKEEERNSVSKITDSRNVDKERIFFLDDNNTPNNSRQPLTTHPRSVIEFSSSSGFPLHPVYSNPRSLVKGGMRGMLRNAEKEKVEGGRYSEDRIAPLIPLINHSRPSRCFPGRRYKSFPFGFGFSRMVDVLIRTTTPFVPALPFVATSLINPPLHHPFILLRREEEEERLLRVLIWGIEFRNRNERKSWKVRNVLRKEREGGGACYRSSA